MKRIIACTLLVCLLLGAFPVSAGQEAELPFSVLSRAAQYSHPQVDFTELQGKRNVTSVAIPSPMMEGQEILKGQKTPLRYILSSDGTHGVYLYIYIYDCTLNKLDDPNFDQDPIAYDTVQFPWEEEIREYSSWWDTTNLSIGTYSILSFTVYNGNQIVTDSAMAYELKVVSEAKPMTGLTITDETTGKKVDAFYMNPYETRVFSIGRNPSPTTDPNNMELSFRGPIMKEYHGVVTAESEGLSHGSATLKVGNQEYTFEVHVCSNETGHRLTKTQIRTAGANIYGVTQIQCADCGLNYTETQDPLSMAFYKFVDVPKTAWYHEEVKAAVLKGLFNGMSEHHFRPEVTMNRAMLVTALWRFAGSPTVNNGLTFSDVPANAWYADAVAWASGSGIVNGVGKDRFSPDSTLTREQMATILYRYAEKIGVDTSARQALDTFPDCSTVSSYAEDPISWAVAEGIISGSQKGDQLFLQPRGNATRAQVAAVMVRTINNILETDHYQIQIPESSPVEEGTYRTTHWRFYEDGTLTLEPTEFDSSYESYNHLKDQIKTLKILDGNTSTEDLSGNFPNLERIEMADSVTEIRDAAFTNCPKLKEIRFSPKLERIKYRAFMDCTALETVELPESLQYLYGAAFQNCTSLREIRLPSGLLNVDNNYSISITETFMNCTALERVYLGVAMRSVPSGMFSGCSNLKEIIFAEGISSIESEGFANCDSLTDLVLPKGICTINDESFLDCKNLKSVTILNPYLYLSTYYLTGEYIDIPAHQPPFPEGCVIRGYTGSTAQTIAEKFGYTFESIGTP